MNHSHSWLLLAVVLIVGLSSHRGEAFSAPNTPATKQRTSPNQKNAVSKKNAFSMDHHQAPSWVASLAFAAIVMTSGGHAVWADEYGVEKEAPTIFTGETVQICTKRGPLGACLKTEARTTENDNDKALKYFKEPSDALKAKKRELDGRLASADEGNLLIEKLMKQTEDNKEKNELLVRQKTLLNDQSASFGPFDRQVVIMNTDGKGFTLLENPQAMRLKKEGFIKDRQFVRQPTPEELEKALEAEGPSLGEAFQGLFGGGD